MRGRINQNWKEFFRKAPVAFSRFHKEKNTLWQPRLAIIKSGALETILIRAAKGLLAEKNYFPTFLLAVNYE